MDGLMQNILVERILQFRETLMIMERRMRQSSRRIRFLEHGGSFFNLRILIAFLLVVGNVRICSGNGKGLAFTRVHTVRLGFC